ncbi:MAG: hypothetical protein Q9213_005685 [Squamulea squamosa]
MAVAAPIGDAFARLTSAAPSTVSSTATATVAAITTVPLAQSTSTSTTSMVPTGVFVWSGPAPTFSYTSIIYPVPSFQTEFPATSSLVPDVLSGPPAMEVDLVERGICQPPACTPLHPAQYPPATITRELEFSSFPTPAIGKRDESAESAHIGAAHFVVTTEAEHVDSREHVAHANHLVGDSAENAHHYRGTLSSMATTTSAPRATSTSVLVPSTPPPPAVALTAISTSASPAIISATATSAEYAHVSVSPQPSFVSAENARVGAPGIDITVSSLVVVDGNQHIGVPSHGGDIGPRAVDTTADGNWHVGVPPTVDIGTDSSFTPAENSHVGAPHVCEAEECHVGG